MLFKKIQFKKYKNIFLFSDSEVKYDPYKILELPKGVDYMKIRE